MPFNLFFRDDIFISYSRRDAGSYAAGLADKLTQKKFSCFSDRLGSEPNEELPESLKKKIMNCTLFVVIGTTGAASSEFVEKEIAEFKVTKRTIVPIDVNGALTRARWYALISGLAPEHEENQSSLKTGEPSPNVVSRIEKSFNYTRRNERMLKFLVLTSAVLLMLVISIVVAAIIAQRSFVAAQEQRRAANEARTRAQAETENANAAEIRATEQTRIADQAQTEAEKQKKEADKATAQARRADASARNAVQRELSARANADEQQRIAQAQLNHNRHLLYVSDIKLAKQEYEVGSVARGEELLNAYLPKLDTHASNQEEFRGYEWYYLWQLYHRNIADLTGYSTEVTAVAFAPNGKIMATGDYQGGVKLWDVTSPQTPVALAQIKAADDFAAGAIVRGSLNSLAFSPDSKILATAGVGGVLKLWNTTTYQELVRFQAHEETITMVAFSPDGKLLATGSTDSTAKLWDASTYKEIATLKGHEKMITALAISSKAMLATGSVDGEVKLWDTTTHREITTLTAHTSEIYAVAFSPSGSTLVTSSRDRTVRLWNTSPRSETGYIRDTLIGHSGVVVSLAFSPDGMTLITADRDGTVELWDTLSYADPVTIRTNQSIISIALSPDGLVLATGGYGEKQVRLWRASRNQAMTRLQLYSPRSVAFSPDNQVLATGNADGSVWLWNPETTVRPSILGVSDMRQSDPLWFDYASVTFSPDGKLIASAGREGAVKLWDRLTLKPYLQFESELELTPLVVKSLVFSYDSRLVASLVDFGYVEVWDIVTRRRLKTFQPDCSVTSIGFLHKNNVLVLGDCDGVVRLWDLTANLEIAKLKDVADDDEAINSMALSFDDKLLVMGDASGTLRLWNLDTRKRIASFKGHEASVECMALSPDAKTLATGGEDERVKLWDIATRQEIFTLVQPDSEDEEPAKSISFSSNGSMLAYSSSKRVLLWHATNDKDVSVQRE